MMKSVQHKAAAALAGGCLLVAASGQADYQLLNPTPADRLREMSTDRPDKTESPYTVDAGHFQIESDLVNFTQDHDTSGGGDTRTEAWSFATLNLKAGLLANTDLQLILEPHQRVRTEDRAAGTVRRQSGFGDVTVRVKQNLWGNDGGKTAFAVMPFVKFPTSQDDLGNRAVEGGIILPLAVELPRGWNLGLMTEVDWLQDDDASGHHASFVNSITFSHDIVGALAGYVEFFSEVSTENSSSWIGTVDLGLTYGLTENIQLDAGINIGVTDAADDVNPFVGASWRF
jgi:hypothetical protein